MEILHAKAIRATACFPNRLWSVMLRDREQMTLTGSCILVQWRLAGVGWGEPAGTGGIQRLVFRPRGLWYSQKRLHRILNPP